MHMSWHQEVNIRLTLLTITPRDPLREFWLSIPTHLDFARLDVLGVGMDGGKEHFHQETFKGPSYDSYLLFLGSSHWWVNEQR